MKKIPDQELLNNLPRYSSLREINAGGFKTVYEARRAEGGGKEALKVVEIPDGSQSDNHEKYRQECIARVKREVSVLLNAKSPYLVKVTDLEFQTLQYDNCDFVIYSEEFLEGENLWDLIRGHSAPPTQEELNTLTVCLLKAIQDLWSEKVVHRDIKPLNVMKTTNPNRPFVLIDLGIAFSIMDTALTFNALNRDPLATFRYIAPERCDPRHRASIDFRCDLYSAALTIFEYAAKKHPIAQDSDDKMLTVTRAVIQEPLKLHDLRKDLDLSFCQLIDQMLKKTPALRPANLSKIISNLEI